MLIPRCTCNTRVTTEQLAQPLLPNRCSAFPSYTAVVRGVPLALLHHKGRQHSRKVVPSHKVLAHRCSSRLHHDLA